MSGAGEASKTPGHSNGSTGALFGKLHPGPGSSPEQVASHQRGRIYGAMIELVSERGYGAVTVKELVRLARVSKHTFYDHFDDKDECFCATYEMLALRSIERVEAAQTGCADWQERLRLAFGAWAGGLASEPRAARVALVEAFAGGPAALQRMRHAEARFGTLIEQSFASAPDGIAVPPLVVQGIVAGMARVARARLLAGRERELADLADEMLEWVFCLRCEETAALGRLAGPVDAVAQSGEALAVKHEDDDRERILDAVGWLAAHEGYWQLTIPRIRSVAGVSRKTFDANFDDVQGAFTATLERLTQRGLALVRPARLAGQDWPGAIHRALHALCGYVAADPVFARLGFVEVFAPGPDGVRFRELMMTGLTEVFRASAPDAQRPPELAAQASVGAIWGIVHQHVAGGHAELLPGVAGTLSFLALAPAIGAEQAVAAIVAEHARMRDGDAAGVGALA
ncbi:MAG: TetR/AcrR family transcriptional regulator [Solirubrobacteraceae bacterium]